MDMNLVLERKIFFMRRWGDQVNAGTDMKIQPSRLSVLLNGRVEPNRNEQRKLRAALGRYHYRRLFGRPKQQQQEAVNG